MERFAIGGFIILVKTVTGENVESSPVAYDHLLPIFQALITDYFLQLFFDIFYSEISRFH
jgi:hypothetical protein